MSLLRVPSGTENIAAISYLLESLRVAIELLACQNILVHLLSGARQRHARKRSLSRLAERYWCDKVQISCCCMYSHATAGSCTIRADASIDICRIISWPHLHSSKCLCLSDVVWLTKAYEVVASRRQPSASVELQLRVVDTT